MAYWRKIGANLFIVAFLSVILIDGIPSQGVLHDRLKLWIDPLVDATGLWQGGWTVFAPNPDRQNHHVEVHIQYDDGSQVHWRSPVWHKLSAWQKYFAFRELELSEKLEQYPDLRPAFVRYLAEQLRPNSHAVYRSATIDYHYFDIWPPSEGDFQRYPDPGQESHFYVRRLYEDPES